MPAAPTRRLISLALPPGEEFIAAFEQAWAAGDAVLPVDPHAPPAVVDNLLAAMRPDDPVEVGVALVIATSGSTGEPKGAQLRREALDASIDAAHARLGREADDVWLSCLPWHHIGGLQVMLRARRLGIPLVVHDRFDTQRFAAAEATLTSLVPTQLAALLDAGVDLRRFRAILLGGAAASASLLARARAAGAAIVTTYGMSETAGGCVYDGRPLDGVQVKVLTDGRLAIRGPMLMSGYRGRADLTAQALAGGWLHTSDLGTVEDGTVTVTGRFDDVIVSGGENVVAGAVATAIGTHPAVTDVAVVGIPDERWGHRVVAVIEATEPVPTLEELRDWCRGVLPAASLPRQVVVVAALPRLPSGKADPAAVARLAGQATPTSQPVSPTSSR
ncbi:MAG TPA: AMP-binding protein [Mycobacteriales bacterium]|jgi:O-succinylbenzoic acid--CoA ligase|nr:AMP-binding protein [Mycobacteriales bacterium]